MIYLTGDTHRDFKLVAAFCDTVDSTRDDVLIILGDAGINYFGGEKDRKRSVTRKRNGAAARSIGSRSSPDCCLPKMEKFMILTANGVLPSAARTAWTNRSGLRRVGAGGRMNSTTRRGTGRARRTRTAQRQAANTTSLTGLSP